MTQQSHFQAYTLRKPKLKKKHESHRSFAALFAIARTWKQLRCPLTDEWIKNLWYIYTMEYYSVIKRNAFGSVLMRQMSLESIIQSEVSQKEKAKYHILTYIYGIQKMVLRNLFTRQQGRNGQRIDLWACGEWRRGCDVWKESHGNLHSVQFSSVVSNSL